MHHQGRKLTQNYTDSETDDNNWDIDKKFEKRESEKDLYKLLYQYTHKSEFDKALLLGVLPQTKKKKIVLGQ